jgi:hypothetical protein
MATATAPKQAPGAAATTRIKGVSFIDMGEFVTAQFGAQALEKLASALGPEVAKTLRSSYGHEWYPFAHIVEIEKKVAEIFFGGDYAQIERFGHFDGTKQVGFIYRVLLKLATPPFLLKQGNRLWHSYMDRGDLATEQLSDRRGVCRLSGYDPIHVAHCYENVGTFKAALQVCGAKAPRVEHVECRLQGAPACRYSLEW